MENILKRYDLSWREKIVSIASKSIRYLFTKLNFSFLCYVKNRLNLSSDDRRRNTEPYNLQTQTVETVILGLKILILTILLAPDVPMVKLSSR